MVSIQLDFKLPVIPGKRLSLVRARQQRSMKPCVSLIFSIFCWFKTSFDCECHLRMISSSPTAAQPEVEKLRHLQRHDWGDGRSWGQKAPLHLKRYWFSLGVFGLRKFHPTSRRMVPSFFMFSHLDVQVWVSRVGASIKADMPTWITMFLANSLGLMAVETAAGKIHVTENLWVSFANLKCADRSAERALPLIPFYFSI